MKDLGVRVNDRVCVFKPKVKVVDNWEWCNGTCISAKNGTGCLNGVADTAGKFSYRCNEDDDENSGTQYNGIIVVVEDKN